VLLAAAPSEAAEGFAAGALAPEDFVALASRYNLEPQSGHPSDPGKNRNFEDLFCGIIL
jgi:hypothetical protein